MFIHRHAYNKSFINYQAKSNFVWIYVACMMQYALFKATMKTKQGFNIVHNVILNCIVCVVIIKCYMCL